jgi:cyclic pyranopterin phosphate synthase
MEGEQSSQDEMSANEIGRLVEIASTLGIGKVKLTGGEPLLRHDIMDIVHKIVPHVVEVSMTSNGVFLEKYAEKLKTVGLKRVNISVHSRDPEKFKMITKSDAFNSVKRGVKAAVKAGLEPVKLNMVVLKGINDAEIFSMIDFSNDCGTILQLIEFQPIQAGTEPYWEQYYLDLREVERLLHSEAHKIKTREFQRRNQYYLKDGGIVEVVRPMHNTGFCDNCTRLRVTSDGKLKPCLMRNDNLLDIIPLIRGNFDKKTLKEAFTEAVSRRKPYWRT